MASHPAQFTPDASSVYLLDLHTEDLFHSSFDLRLGGAHIHLKRVFVLSHQVGALLRDNRPLNDVTRIHYASTSSSLATASLVMTSFSLFRISYTFKPTDLATTAPGILRTDSSTFLSHSAVTKSGFCTSRARNTPAITLVFGASTVS